ncbi:MAG: 2,3-bisphosphoglycerate-independent phosphoglycerate mutase [SAR324 cluster bacterium]|nr:2,3-bisphosphoglycerate-independent phosphoglycerate mutase [SAR324 cluster bacterium]
MNYPTLILILDGVGDESHQILNAQTPLQAASLPNLDWLAKTGQCGQVDPVKPGAIPSTTEGTLGILGYDPLVYSIGRGVMEAFGAGISLESGDVALRGNFACLAEDNRIQDRRAGRIRDGTSQLIDSLEKIPSSSDVEVILGNGTEHRIALVLRGKKLSDQIIGSDPKETNANSYRITPYATNNDDTNAQRTAFILDQFERASQNVLSKHPLNRDRIQNGFVPANAILTRDPGKSASLPPISVRERAIRGIFISGDKTVLGLAKMADLESVSSPLMTGNLDTNLSAKFEAALGNLDQTDLVVIHIKGCDIAAHDRRPRAKRDFLMKIDRELGQFLEKWGEDRLLRIGIIGDHGTSSKKGCHISDPVPVIIHHPELPADSVDGYDEVKVAQGGLGRFPGHQFLEKLWYGNTFRNERWGEHTAPLQTS